MDRKANNGASAEGSADGAVDPDGSGGDFGINAAFVEEIRDSFRVDPDSVHPDWSGVFDGGRPTNGAPASAPAAEPVAARAPAPAPRPAATPAPVIARLEGAINKALLPAQVREQLGFLGVKPEGSTPEAMKAFVVGEIERWKRVVRASGIEQL